MEFLPKHHSGLLTKKPKQVCGIKSKVRITRGELRFGSGTGFVILKFGKEQSGYVNIREYEHTVTQKDESFFEGMFVP